MEEKKRKTKTSSAVKNRYNSKVYDSIIVRVPKETAEAFKAKCSAENIPQAQIIKKAIADFLNQEQLGARFTAKRAPYFYSKTE